MNDDKNLTYCKGQKKESSQEFWSIQCFATNNGVPYLQGMSENKSTTMK